MYVWMVSLIGGIHFLPWDHLYGMLGSQPHHVHGHDVAVTRPQRARERHSGSLRWVHRAAMAS